MSTILLGQSLSIYHFCTFSVPLLVLVQLVLLFLKNAPSVNPDILRQLPIHRTRTSLIVFLMECECHSLTKSTLVIRRFVKLRILLTLVKLILSLSLLILLLIPFHLFLPILVLSLAHHLHLFKPL